MPFWLHVYRSIRYGQWSCGWATQKTWAGKPRLAFCVDYCDGWHWALHVGPFYVGSSFY